MAPPAHSSVEVRTCAVNRLSMSGASSRPRPGPGGTVIKPSLTSGQRGDEIAVPGAVIGAHALLDEGVRRVQRQMRRGGEHHRPGAVVRRDRQVPGLGHRSDLARLGEAAAPGDVEHDDAGGAGLEEIAEGPARAERLRGADRRRRGLGIAPEVAEAVHPDRVLVPEGLVGRERAGDGHRRQELPERMELDHDLHAVADRLADLLERDRAPSSGRRSRSNCRRSSPRRCRTARSSSP